MRVNLEARAAAAEQRKAQTRERLLEAAIAVIGDKGPDACSIEDFVAAADVSRGTFYNYFPTAEDLLRAVRLKITLDVAGVLDAVLPPSMPPAERLATRLHSYVASVLHDPAWGWVMLRLDSSRLQRTPDLETNLDKMYLEGVALGEFRQMDIPSVRTLVFGTVRMLQRDILLGPCEADHPVQVVAAVLYALGISPERADQISREAQRLAEEIRQSRRSGLTSHYKPVM